ncbi:hypothetical protein PAXINDRAFT_96730 [Paxillus involutus ATCC 200175]|nr:hypothetical protein PAXINDRAFT_96730 [Paxillus involutus ATCC 200175]
MSLIQWTTPERRTGDRILPIIPNEIYLIILEHIAPASTKPSPEQLLTFSKLSRICRFFYNIYLPRIFEYLELSGSIFSGDPLPAHEAHMASRGWILCQQIATKQPLALYLAQFVKACHFTDWAFGSAGSLGAQMFLESYISGMARMKNIRELHFSDFPVKKAHWDAIKNLESLEELSFTYCDFVDGPADVDPGKRLKVKVSCLQVYECGYSHQLAAALDVRHLRTLTTDMNIDWLSETTLTELSVNDGEFCGPGNNGRLRRILSEMPQSIQVLTLPVYDRPDIELFGDPLWKNRPLLRSLTLQRKGRFSEATMTASLLA